MTQPLDLHSERFAATGGLAAEGALNSLGRPRLDPLSVLVRETVQNSWDARLDSTGVAYKISGQTFTAAQQLLLNDILSDLPPELPSGDGHNRVLLITDRGTTGLGGPTRADQVIAPGQPRGFVSFLRNVGRAAQLPTGGGTYGYGKAILYLISQRRTILVHTRCLVNSRQQSRFMAAALGQAYSVTSSDERSGMYTGRHWWGCMADDGIIEPIVGDDADHLAGLLGFPADQAAELGTSVMILDPDYGECGAEVAFSRMSQALLWYAWPKLLDAGNGPPMRAELFLDGVKVPLPDPRSHPELQHFAHALETVKAGRAANPLTQLQNIRVATLRRISGVLALHRFIQPSAAIPSEGEGGFWPAGTLRHVALLRAPELVVRYLEGPELPAAGSGYAGVFLADQNCDPVFAEAEPPTHDDWRSEGLHGVDATTVNATLRHLKRYLREYTMPPAVQPMSGSARLGGFSEYLGQLLPGDEGYGAGVDSSESPPGRAPSRSGSLSRTVPSSRLNLLDSGRLQVWQGKRVLGVDFTVEHAPAAVSTLVSAEANTVLEGTTLEFEPPAGSDIPQIVGWLADDGELREGGPSLLVQAVDRRSWRVLVHIPEDASVQVLLSARGDAR